MLYVAPPNVDVAADTVAVVGVDDAVAAVDGAVAADGAAVDAAVVAVAVHVLVFVVPCTKLVVPAIVSTTMSAVFHDPSGKQSNSPPPHVNASGTGTVVVPHRHPRNDFLNRPPISLFAY